MSTTVDTTLLVGSAEAPPERAARCPKCRLQGRSGERACARCGLLVSRFDRFAADEADPASALLDERWRECRSAWSDPATHDRIVDLATRNHCLPALARRYREALDTERDPVAEKRLQQIAVLIEHAVRAQARDPGSARAARTLWLLGYLVAATVMALSAWVFLIALRRH